MKSHDYPIGCKTFLVITLSVSESAADSISLAGGRGRKYVWVTVIKHFCIPKVAHSSHNIPVLYTKNLRPREIRWFARGHTASQQENLTYLVQWTFISHLPHDCIMFVALEAREEAGGQVVVGQLVSQQRSGTSSFHQKATVQVYFLPKCSNCCGVVT